MIRKTARPRRGTGFGLSGVQRRLYLLFARNDLMETHANDNIFTTIIKIPQLYMKRALIIDDEPLARMVVKEYLQNFKDQIEVLQECNDGFEGLESHSAIPARPDIS